VCVWLAESAAAERLVRLFRSLLGWMPGGIAVMVAAVCALFTTFTGGSRVTIIALGGLVYPILRKDGYSAGFSLDHLYIAGLLPGLLLIVLTVICWIMVGRHVAKDRQAFSWKELAIATWKAKWELGLRFVVMGLFVSGWLTMKETAAAALSYAVIVECFITRDLHLFKTLPGVLLKAAGLTGPSSSCSASPRGSPTTWWMRRFPTRSWPGSRRTSTRTQCSCSP